MPSLKIAKRKAQGVVCLSRQNTLGKSWCLYNSENGDWIPSPDTPLNPIQHSGNIVRANWACSPQTETGTNKGGASTVEEKIIGIKKGVLYPYIESPEAYHCPGDKRSSKPRLRGSGGMGGYRSYSMPGSLVNGSFVKERVLRQNQIMSPDSMNIFIEESDGRGYNVNSWVINNSSNGWIDPIAIWHGNTSTLGFADGHADSHKWYGKGTLEMAQNQTFYYTPQSPKDIEDFEFMKRGYPHTR